jgi:hypothetical protein
MSFAELLYDFDQAMGVIEAVSFGTLPYMMEIFIT